jgi:hypothetical protein
VRVAREAIPRRQHHSSHEVEGGRNPTVQGVQRSSGLSDGSRFELVLARSSRSCGRHTYAGQRFRLTVCLDNLGVLSENIERTGTHPMLPLYAARVSDLRPGDFVIVECPSCGHDGMIHPAALASFGLRFTQRSGEQALYVAKSYPPQNARMASWSAWTLGSPRAVAAALSAPYCLASAETLVPRQFDIPGVPANATN